MADNNATRIILSAVDQTGAAFASINKGLGNLQSAAGALGPVLGGLTGALSAGAFVGFVKGTIDAADGMRDMSQRIGIGIKDLAGWTLAANQSGTSMESVAKGVKTLSVYMVEHREKLKAAGITATDANGAMVQLADLFAAMPDGIEKTALAAQLFGKAGGDMIAMLNLGSKGLAEAQAKAAAYGKKLEELAPKADEFNDLVEELALNSKAAGMNIADYLLPGLIGMAKWFNDVASGGEKAQQAVEYFLGERGMKALVLVGHPMLTGGGTRSVSGRIGGAGPKAMTLDEELALGDANIARMTALGLLDKPAGGKTGKVKSEIYGPPLYADIAAALKEEAAAAEAANKAIAEHSEKLGKDIAAAERALETYGLTESQIADLTLARIKHARAMEAEQDADEATLAYYDQEIDALERIRTAKFAVEARDTAKKEAEDAAKAWQNFARDLESSLTDALMRSFEAGDSFGEAFKDNLENLFKTMILKAAVQVSVSTLAGGVERALGLNGGGSGGSGSLGSLLSTGSSLYNAATGGGIFGSISGFGAGAASAASELALGASFVGPSASLAGGAVGAGATAGLASGSAGAASSLSGLAAAAPWIAGGLAIASIFGGDLFGKKKPAPIEWGLTDLPLNDGINYAASLGSWQQYAESGPFSTVATVGQHLSRNGQSAAGLQSAVTSPLVQLDKTLASYMSAKEIRKVGAALVVGNEGEHGWSQAEVDGVMMRRLGRISDAIGGWTDDLFDQTTGNLQERYGQLAKLLALKNSEGFDALARRQKDVIGSVDVDRLLAFQSNKKQFESLFLGQAEQAKTITDDLRAQFEKLSVSLPETRDGFRDLVKGVNTATGAGYLLYETLVGMAPTMDAYYDSLQAELDVKRQLTAMNGSHFATAVDFTRYQRIAGNFDETFAGDYAYNIARGAIQPGGAANGDLVAELRALRTENQAQAVALATAQQETARILRRWNGDGMPAERVVA